MRLVTIMEFHLFSKWAIICALLTAATAMAYASNKTIAESVKSMERELSLKIMWQFDLASSVRHTRKIPNDYSLYVSSISPGGTELAWSSYPTPYRGEKVPFLTVESLKEGIQTIEIEGRVAVDSGVSAGAEVIVALAIPLDPHKGRHWELLAIDRRSGVVVHDLSPFVTQFKLGNNVGDIHVSEAGTLVAFGTRDQIQVLEIPSGKTLYAGHGSCSRLSPDGKRLAFVDKDRILIHSFADGSTVRLPVRRVKGVGGWSPDGRFLLAGAWTTPLAFEKRQIIVDTATAEYAVIGKLSEGDYGCAYGWVSLKLLNRFGTK